MKLILVGLLVTTFVFAANAQDLSNATIQQRIRSVKVDNGITLTFDEAGRTSKLMAISDNFAKDETSRAGLLAMNFALGCIYAGDSLSKSPDNFIFTFWVLTRKPRFSENHAMTVALGEEMLVIGSARYVAKSSQQMEYLNFEISRANLAKIAAETNVRFHLGDDVFVFSRSQLKLIAETLAVTEVGN